MYVVLNERCILPSNTNLVMYVVLNERCTLPSSSNLVMYVVLNERCILPSNTIKPSNVCSIEWTLYSTF